MTVDRSRASTQGAIQETAQAMVKQGELVAAVTLLDRYLSQFDGDWGVWLYFAGLCARLGKRDEAVAAYRACARQLEADGHFERARDALASAIKLVPRDAALKRELEQVGRPVKRQDPVQETFLVMPAVKPEPKPRTKLPDPAVHLTAVIPGRAKKQSVTDPHFAIFDIIDAERLERPMHAKALVTVSGRRRDH